MERGGIDAIKTAVAGSPGFRDDPTNPGEGNGAMRGEVS